MSSNSAFNLGARNPLDGGGAGDFVPTDLSGLQLWYETNLNNVTLQGGKVSQIDDLSGNGNDATQGTDAFRPVFTTNEVGGEPAMVFATDQLIAPDAPGLQIADNCTWFVVGKTDGSINESFFSKGATGSGGQGSTSLNYLYAINTGGNGRDNIFDGTTFVSSSSLSGTRTVYNILHGVWENGAVGLNLEFFENGASLGGSNPTNTWFSNNNVFVVGAQGAQLTNPLHGGIASLILYNTTLSPAQQDQVLAYLSDLYGIAVV